MKRTKIELAGGANRWLKRLAKESGEVAAKLCSTTLNCIMDKAFGSPILVATGH